MPEWKSRWRTHLFEHMALLTSRDTSASVLTESDVLPFVPSINEIKDPLFIRAILEIIRLRQQIIDLAKEANEDIHTTAERWGSTAESQSASYRRLLRQSNAQVVEIGRLQDEITNLRRAEGPRYVQALKAQHERELADKDRVIQALMIQQESRAKSSSSSVPTAESQQERICHLEVENATLKELLQAVQQEKQQAVDMCATLTLASSSLKSTKVTEVATVGAASSSDVKNGHPEGESL